MTNILTVSHYSQLLFSYSSTNYNDAGPVCNNILAFPTILKEIICVRVEMYYN